MNQASRDARTQLCLQTPPGPLSLGEVLVFPDLHYFSVAELLFQSVLMGQGPRNWGLWSDGELQPP